MFVKEAEWVADCLARIVQRSNGERLTALNLGSSTGSYRAIYQPHINRLIFLPHSQHFEFTYADAKAGEGVDVAGDFCEPDFWKTTLVKRYDVIICTNLLTHVVDRTIIVKMIKMRLKHNGFIILSSPELYPHCADPYDARFRPDLSALAGLFPEFQVLDARTIYSLDSHLKVLLKNWRSFAIFICDCMFPRRGLRNWLYSLSDIPHLMEYFRTSCIFLQLQTDVRA